MAQEQKWNTWSQIARIPLINGSEALSSAPLCLTFSHL